MADTRKTIIILAGILIAVVVVSIGIMLVLPSQPGSTPGSSTQEQAAMQTQSQNLDTSVLQRSNYTQINNSLIQQGNLPVPPPAGTGKANPFL